MMRVFIDGAAGTTGLEIEERLAGRTEFELLRLDEGRRKDSGARRDALNAADVVILCLPDDAAIEAVALVDNATTRIIDASSAHRVAVGWTYGFPELGHDVAGARRVSNPGCYPTGFLALVAPLVRAGVVPSDWALSVNAVSGYSGGGKALIARYRSDPGLGHRAYGFDLAHKHLPEMQRHAGLAHAPVFAPSVARAFRGMIVEVPLSLTGIGANAAQVREILREALDGRGVISVVDDRPDELLLHDDAVPHDGLTVRVLASSDDNQCRLIATLDNLGKGAAGAAVQNLNLMAGLPELTGLRL